MKQLVRLAALILCVWGLLAVIFWGTQAQRNAHVDYYQEQPLSPLTVQVLDVGKGDALVLTCQGETWVIDTGYDKTFSVLLDALEQAGATQVDTLIITHFDKDHVGGADKLIEAMPVGQILVPACASDAKQYLQLVEAAQQAGLDLQAVTEPLELSLGDAQGVLYPPLLEDYQGDNDFSLVLSLIHGADRFLFAGDAENARLQEVMGQMPLEHTFLKMPHHGRPEESTPAFLRAVSPEYAVITCAPDDPDPDEVSQTLQLLEDLGVKTYLTCDGSVTAVSLGDGYMTLSQG